MNRAGGVNGRRLELRSYDDRYEPELAIANTRKLINDGRRLCADRRGRHADILGRASRSPPPPAFPSSRPSQGAEFLRDPALTNVVNIRASYSEETEAIWSSAWSDDLGLSRIGVLYQDDSYGRSGLAGVKQALERRGIEPVGTEAYMRNTTAVKTALLGLKRQNPEAIVIIGAYLPSAVFTKWARKLGVKALLLNLSFVGSEALATTLGPAGDGVYITQVVPFPEGDAMPLQEEYRAALAANDPTAHPSFGSLEGYIAGRLTAEVLARAGDTPTRESFLAALTKTGTFDIGGFVLKYGARRQ